MKRKLPTAVELAQIAASLPVDSSERESVQKAVALCWESEDILAELKERMADPNDLLLEYRSQEAIAKEIEAVDETNSIHLKTWETDCTKCPAREFIRENGYVMKTPNTVLKNILKHGGQGAENRIEQAKRKTSKGTLYAFPIKLLERVVAVRKKKKSEEGSKGHVTRQKKNSGKKKATRSRSKQK
jgi:hypothetical protein